MSETLYISQSAPRSSDASQKGLLFSILRPIGQVAQRWVQGLYDRRILQALPEHRLWDIGLTRDDVVQLTAQPFWQPVDYDWLEARRRSNSRCDVRRWH